MRNHSPRRGEDAASSHAPRSEAGIGREEEFVYPPEATLMSTTDLDSYVRYANAAFLDVSGYSREQMLGRPHNLVRHPDMPREAFADLWATLKGGEAWSALVKNRRADGAHYWVRANVTPVRQGGELVGYLSVRTQPERREIDAAAALYRRFRDGRARGLAFHKGLIVRTGLMAWTRLARVLPVRWRIRLALAAVAAVTGLAAAAAAMATAAGGAFAGGLAAAPALLAALMAALWLEAGIARPLSQVLKQANAVAAGQPGARDTLQRVDEIGMLLRAINQAGLNLRAMVGDVAAQMQGIEQSNQRIADGNELLKQRTAQTHARLQETAAASEQMASAVQHSAETGRRAHELAGGASEAVRNGGSAISQVMQAMTDIARSNAKIAEINGLIDSIAFQTNILALNAAVEAARAGESGRGFAVVAGEVRSLAQRSSQAARDIKQLISENADKSRNGAQHAEQAGRAMEDIVDKVQHVSALINEMSTSASEQSSGVDQVSKAMVQVDQMTRDNALLVEDLSTAVHDMLMRTGRLSEAVQAFDR
ncbi:MAG: methyl-accepting chemotaxis protein [Burkholderiaceae bacterium]